MTLQLWKEFPASHSGKSNLAASQCGAEHRLGPWGQITGVPGSGEEGSKGYGTASEVALGAQVSVTCLVTQLCPPLCNPVDCNPPGSSVYGIFQAKILEFIAIYFSRESSQPRDQTHIFFIGRRILTTEPLVHDLFCSKLRACPAQSLPLGT